MKLRILGVSGLALGLAACGAQKDGASDDYLDGVPEQAALEMRLTEDAQDEALSREQDAIAARLAADGLGSVSAALDANAADALRHTQGSLRELNEALRNFLGPIVALVRNTPPDEIERNVAQWGPVTRGATEYRFFVKRGLFKRYGWLLQGRPAGGDEAYANVAAGGIDVGQVVRRGIGTVGVDLDAFGTVDPTVEARGKVLAGFAHGPRGTVLAYGLKGFTRSADDTTPISAAFEGVHLEGGYNRIRLAYHGNLPETATEAEELVLARVRHHRGDGGRADLLVMGGDIADGHVWVVSECWDRDTLSAFRVVRDCPGDGIGGAQCETVATRGARTACLPDLLDPELPPLDPEEHMDDSESPEPDLLPPDEMPSGEAE